MKVVHINTYDSGGAAVAMFRLHRSLLDSGIDSHVLILEQSGKVEVKNLHVFDKAKDSFTNKVTRKLGFKPTHREKQVAIVDARAGDYETYTFPLSDQNVADHPIVKSADIIVLHWIARFIDYPTFFKRIEQPLVWVFHDMNVFQGGFHYSEDQTKYYEAFKEQEEEAITIKKAAYENVHSLTIVSPSDWLKKASEASSLTGHFAHRTIRNVGDHQNFKPLEKEVALKELGLPKNNRFLLFLSANQNIKRKGMDLLNEAIDLTSLPDNVSFLAVGNPMDNSHPLVRQFGYVTDVKTLNLLYNAADAIILPSREDNLPNVMLESLSSGTPIICFRTGGMAEIIVDGEHGVLADKISAKDLSQAIERFLNTSPDNFDPRHLQAYSKSKFGQVEQAKEYIELFEKLLDE